jgi:hypothetical protein
MRCRTLALLAGLSTTTVVAGFGCEDGPKQIFSPNEGDPASQNGLDHPTAVTPPGTKSFDTDDENRDDTGRGKFCTVEENGDLVEVMVKEPIIPNESIGGVPMWTADNRPMQADELLKEGRWCDPDIYADGFVWGPLQEVVFLFDQETRLIVQELALSQYQGALAGNYTGVKADGSTGKVPVSLTLRNRVTVDGLELDQYAARGEEAEKPRAWVNPKNVNAIYRMVRETFFGDEPFAEDFDCKAAKVCDVIFLADKVTRIDITDSGMIIILEADGTVSAMSTFPVRVAPFERETAVAMGEETAFGPRFASVNRPECEISLLEDLNYGQFRERCIGNGENSEKALQRAGFNVHGQRDGVDVEFNGATFTFKRDMRAAGAEVLKDGERPSDSDSLRGFSFARGLSAPVAEFRPRTLAQAFKARLEQRIHEAVNVPAVGGGAGPDAGAPVELDAAVVATPDAGNTPDATVSPVTPDAAVEPPVEPPVAVAHPFQAWTLDIPNDLLTDEADTPRPIDQLTYKLRGATRDWVGDVVANIRKAYDALPPEQQAQVNPKVIEASWVLEAFTGAVLDVFSHGHVNDELAVTRFFNTDDKRWSVGYAHFVVDGVPFRMTVQFSLNFDALTYVGVTKGYTTYDEVFNSWNDRARERPQFGERSPYYGLDLASVEPGKNYLALGAAGILVRGYDRKLNTLEVEIYEAVGEDSADKLALTVKGDPIEDRNGYLKQIRGQRWEFVPANVVQMNGSETSMLFWVEADGRIGKISEGGFKHPINLCPGLSISFGDDVRAQVEQFVATKGAAAWQACDIVFNYSANGNVLDEVASLTNQVSFYTSNGRAYQANIWR